MGEPDAALLCVALALSEAELEKEGAAEVVAVEVTMLDAELLRVADAVADEESEP